MTQVELDKVMKKYHEPIEYTTKCGSVIEAACSSIAGIIIWAMAVSLFGQFFM